MGNTQKLKNKVKSIFNKEHNPNDKIGKQSECLNCGAKFPRDATYQMYHNHLESCLQNRNAELSEPEEPEVALHEQHIKVATDVYTILEKVPANDERTEFKWEKRPLLASCPMEIINLPPEAIVKRSFQEKQAWFRFRLEKYRIPWEAGADWMHIEKDNVLMTSINAISKVNMHKEVKINFANEKVNDAGGLLRQWMHLAIKEIFDETTGIFTLCNTQQIMYKIRSDEELDREFAQSLFSLFGTILGKAIFQRIPLTCYLDRPLLRQLCCQRVTLSDVNGFDRELYKSWKYLMSNHIQPFGQFFALQKQTSNKTIQEIELVENGSIIEVTEENKDKFVQLCLDYYCTNSVSHYIDAIRKNLYRIVPASILCIFDVHEFEMILYGLPFINVEDWLNNTDYKGAYYKNHQIIKWFWKVVKEMDQERLARLLHFCTGSSRTPIYGFKKLQTNRGNYAKFLIESVAYSKINPFPKGHTCFNRLQLPMYPTEQLLRSHVMAIVNNNLDGIYGLD